LSTKNACEFKFTNTSQATLKITNVRSTCGYTVAKLEKKEYSPGESGTIKVAYTAPKKATTTQKYIYVSFNDKISPKICLTIKGKITQMVQADPAKLLPYRQAKSWQATREDRRGTLDESMEPREKNLGLNGITIASLDRDSEAFFRRMPSSGQMKRKKWAGVRRERGERGYPQPTAVIIRDHSHF